VVDILRALPREREEGLVFVGARRGAQLGEHTLRLMLHRMGRNVTVHGFRSSFRDWAADRTHYPNHVVEMALAHSIGNAVEKAYRRGELLDKRGQLMDAWSKYCESIPARGTTEANIIELWGQSDERPAYTAR
jgi:integrase